MGGAWRSDQRSRRVYFLFPEETKGSGNVFIDPGRSAAAAEDSGSSITPPPPPPLRARQTSLSANLTNFCLICGFLIVRILEGLDQNQKSQTVSESNVHKDSEKAKT